MKSYVIGYDLHKPGRDYTSLIEAIKTKYPTYWKALESMWIVVTHKNAVEIRDSLTPYIDPNDDLIVAGLTGEAAWYGFSEPVGKWLQESLATVSV